MSFVNNETKVETKPKKQKAIATTLPITFINDDMKVVIFFLIMNLQKYAKEI